MRLVPPKATREGTPLGQLVPEFQTIIESRRQKALLDDVRADQAPPEEERIKPDPNTARPRPSGHKNGTESEGFTARTRPEGPRKREVNEMGAIYTGPNVLVKMDADTISFDVKRPLVNETRGDVEMHLSEAQQNRLVAAGFDDISQHGDASAWMAPKTMQSVEAAQLLAVEFDGKSQRVGRGR